MILQVHELGLVGTDLKQSITVGVEHIAMQSVQLHLYRHKLPSGSLTLELRDKNGKAIKTSNTIAIASLPNTLDYFHGYIKFDLVYQLKAGQNYYFALKSSGGYSFSELAYIGWVNDFDLRNVPSAYAPDAGISAPLGLRIWAQEILQRGVI